MGDSVYRMKDGEEISVEVSGNLSGGWLAGTWARYVNTEPVFSDAVVGVVERSDGTGILAGFLRQGPQHNNPVEQLSDMWKVGENQTPGGDHQYDWTSLDIGMNFQFDDDGTLSRFGSRVATLSVPPTGYYKFYVFEVNDKTERNNPGSGSALVYTPNDLLYVSENGLLTNEQETGSHIFTGYAVARRGTDEEGNYIFAIAVMI